MLIKLFNKRTSSNVLSDKQKRWNGFIEKICNQEIEILSPTQRNAVLCFWYDAEMNSGGHSGYFECYKDINYDELIKAINIVSYKEIADNLIEALKDGKTNGWADEDNKYYEFKPSLSDCLMEYVERNRDEIFNL